MGLVVLGLLMMSLSALAAAPKVIQLDEHSMAKRAAARQADWAEKNPEMAAKFQAQQQNPDKNMVPPNSEAYAYAGAGYAEGWADVIATNGYVTAWSNDTFLFGCLTFAAANDIAHPTAYVLGGYARPRPLSMQFVGNMLYVNAGYYIDVFDCTDPNNIEYYAFLDFNCYTDGNRISDYRVRNGYLYAVFGEGFIIFDLGNPTYPVMLGTAAHATENRGLYAFDPNGWWFWATQIEVTDDTMILIDNYTWWYGDGAYYAWDITNMVDPIHTVVPYAGGSVFGNYIDPLAVPNPLEWVALVFDFDIGLPYFGGINQASYVSGWMFLGNSAFAGYAGVTRCDWADESNPDSFLALYGSGWSINDGFTGNARYVNNFAIVGTGSFCFVAYDEVRDPGPPFTLPDVIGDAGEKWDWSVWNAPVSLLVYKTDRFFFNDATKFEHPTLGYNYFYGGGHIAFYAPTYGAFRTYIAAYNYVAAYDDWGMLVDHYTTTANPEYWIYLYLGVPLFTAVQPMYKLPSGASAGNFVIASDDSFILYWFPEGVAVVDTATGVRTGFWECPSRADFVRNVALTSDNHYALVSCGSLGLITLDLSSPSNPVKVGNWWTNPTAAAIAKQPVTYVFINGRYAYVQSRVLVADVLNPTANINVVRVLDISNPPLPAEVAAYTAPATGVEWDVNHMELANAYTYLGHVYLQIANGQGLDFNGVWEPAYTNCPAYNNYNPANRGSFVVANITNPAVLANMFNVPLSVSTYAYMSAFYVPTNQANYWAYIADGWLEVVDMGDPASGLLHTQLRATPNLPYGWYNASVDPDLVGFPTGVDKVWRVSGFDQILVNYWMPYNWLQWNYGAYGSYSFDHYDCALPLAPFQLPPTGLSSALLYYYGGIWFGQFSDDTWVVSSLCNDLTYFLNKADYVAPAFTMSGPHNNGWWDPYCGSTNCGIINAPLTLRVQVIDNVAVTQVQFRAYFRNGDAWDYCDGYGATGYIILGNGTGPDANNFWTLTVDPSDFYWTGWVQFRARARDAGNNITYQYNVTSGGANILWFAQAQPGISVEVGPAGTDYAYVWSTTTVAAQVTPMWGDYHVVRVLFKVDGLSIGDGLYNPSTDRWYVNWNTTQVLDGDHVITAEVTTSNSSVAVSDPVTKYVANGGPDSMITTPIAGQMVYGSTTCGAHLMNAQYPVPIHHVDFVLDRPAGATSGGTVIGTATAPVSPGGDYEITYDFAQVVDGNHTLVAVFYDIRWDGTMRSKPSSWVSFSKVTPTPLVVSIAATPTNPTDAQTVAFTSTVSGGIAPYTYNWSSSPAGVSGTGSGTAYKFATGSYTVSCEVTDALGTTETATLDITVTSAVAITVVSKVCDANGWRLIVNGYGFVSGAVVKINGAAVTTKFKSGNQLVAKNCKSLCPKGVAVQVTVTNPDGSTSAPFSFTR
jgi:hypothetical protein